MTVKVTPVKVKNENPFIKFYETRMETLLQDIVDAVASKHLDLMHKKIAAYKIAAEMHNYHTCPKALKNLSKELKRAAVEEASRCDGIVCTMQIWNTIKLKNPKFQVFEEKSKAATKARVGQHLVVKALKEANFAHGGHFTISNRLWNNGSKDAKAA